MPYKPAQYFNMESELDFRWYYKQILIFNMLCGILQNKLNTSCLQFNQQVKLTVQNVLKEIGDKLLQWFGYVNRMD